MARNCIERIFGVVKKRWRILVHPPEFDMDIQARIPPALAALHNFILDHDQSDLDDFVDVIDENPGAAHYGNLATHHVTPAEKQRASLRRDQIAQSMWEDYQAILREREDEAWE